MDNPDDSPKPLERIPERDLSRVVKSGFQTVPTKKDASAEKERNLQRAKEELGDIEALANSSAFVWFYATAIVPGFKSSRAALEEPNQSPEKLVTANAEFNVWRQIAQWLDKREYEHRRLLNPDDPKLSILRERLDLH